MRRWLCALLVALATGCAAAPYCERTYPDRDPGTPFLWAVRGEAGTAVLFGTFHAAGPDDVPSAAWDLLEQAEVFVAEVDEVEPDDVATGRLREDAFNLPPGRSIRQEMPADDFDRLVFRLESTAESIDGIKPWVSIGLLIKTVHTFPFPNMSAALLGRARAQSMPAEFFDTWEQQVAFLDATVGVDDLTGAVRAYDRLACDLGDDVARYRAGDAAVAGAGTTDPDDPRVRRWTDRVVEYLTTGRRAFVAVGVGNIVGPHGMVAALRARGFAVTRITPGG